MLAETHIVIISTYPVAPRGFQMIKVIMLLSVLAFTVVGCLPTNPRSDFFPKGAWGEPAGTWTEEKQEILYEEWFGDQLATLGERPLWGEESFDSSNVTMRLLFLPSRSIARLTTSEDGHMSFVFKQLDIKSRRISRTVEGDVEPKLAEQIAALVNSIDPWGNSTPAQISNPTHVCFDGTTIVLEFRDHDRYKVITRHECEMPQENKIRLLVNLLDEVSGGLVILPQTFRDQY